MSRRGKTGQPDRPGPLRRTCRLCEAPLPRRETPWHPFCSERCKLRDLGSWASGHYAIPGEKSDQDDDGRNSDPEAG
jgi:endogenous inhibitor of DNA gyrase (YacG/DUF329 family)